MRALTSSIRDLDIAVLAGGLGTRLAPALPDVPKVLAPVAGRPFLDHLLAWLAGQGAAHVVLCLGHLADAVERYLNTAEVHGLDLTVIVEPRPLGTAGAVAFASPVLKSDPVMVINGDTFVHADLAAFLRAHCDSDAAVSIVCARVEHAGRYGRVDLDTGDRVIRFAEKDSSAGGPGWINAGVYLFSRRWFGHITQRESGSLERDVLEGLPPGTIRAFRTNGPFLDIGTPETWAEASALWAAHPLSAVTRLG